MARIISKSNNLSQLCTLFGYSLICFALLSCSKAAEENTKPVEWNGTCSHQFAEDYHRLLDLETNDTSTLNAECTRFYQQYQNIKCLTEVEGIEVRVHTSDFDLKCSKGDFKDYQEPNKGKDKNKIPNENLENQSGNEKYIQKCSNELLSYFQRTESSFELTANLINKSKNLEVIFNKSLSGYRVCNQYFHIYKYSSCLGPDSEKFSYSNLKPYCHIFRNKLESLNKKYPEKYFPEEFIHLENLKLRFKINDPFISFFSKVSLVKSLIVDGKSLSNSAENKKKNYCYFISSDYKSSERIINREIKFTEIIKESASLWRLTAFVESRSFQLRCRSPRQLYLQDLKETLGNKLHIFAD